MISAEGHCDWVKGHKGNKGCEGPGLISFISSSNTRLVKSLCPSDHYTMSHRRPISLSDLIINSTPVFFSLKAFH